VTKPLSDERGLSSVEYVVLLVLIGGLGVATWNVLGNSIACKLAGASSTFDSFVSTGASGSKLARCADSNASGRSASTLLPHGSGRAGENRQGLSADQAARAPTKPTSSAPNKAAVAKKWASQVKRLLCPDEAALLKDMKDRGATVTLYDRIYWEDPYYDGSKWTTKHFEGAGSASGGNLKIIKGGGTSENAATLFHEGTHFQQPSAMSRRDKEYDAYAKEDAWRLKHGLPPHEPSFRTTGPDGKQRTNTAAIKAYVDREYPGVTAAPTTGSTPDEIVGQRNGQTVLERADGSQYERPPQRGDSFPGPMTTEPKGGIPVDLSLLQC
jgi:Flp pilus assembly pilin Flp